MSECPTCGTTSPPDPQTGYDGGDFCSGACEDGSRPLRHLVEEQVDGAWYPAANGISRQRLFVFAEDRRDSAEWYRDVLNLRAFARTHRVVETRETDAELRARRWRP